jgi:hypothetical protein
MALPRRLENAEKKPPAYPKAFEAFLRTNVATTNTRDEETISSNMINSENRLIIISLLKLII